MQDTQTIIVLLTAIVSVLSILVIVSLGLLIMVLVKARRIARRVDQTTATIAKATEWLSPAKLISEVTSYFNKRKP